MNFLDLRDPVLLEIISFLPLLEVIRLAHTSKSLLSRIASYPRNLSEQLKVEFNLRLSPENSENYSVIINVLKQLYTTLTLTNQQFFAYYTNGRIWNNIPDYSIHSLFSQYNQVYCTEGNYKNVLVKGVYYPYEDYEHTVSGLNIAGSCLNNNEVLFEAAYQAAESRLNLNKEYVIISKALLSTKAFGFTCPVYRLMCFLGSTDATDPEIIRNFHCCTTPELVKARSDEINLSYTETVEASVTIIKFKKKNGEIQPLFWVDMEQGTHNGAQNIEITLETNFIGRILYVLLIDAELGETSPQRLNIDAKGICFQGFSIKLNK